VPGASWDGATCGIPSGTTLTINSGDLLVVAAVVGLYNQGTIVIPALAFLYNYGSVLNGGTMSLDHGAINNQSNFTNDGVIDNGGLIDHFCTWSGGPFPLCQ